MGIYLLHGLRIDSDVPLPAAEADPLGGVDLWIREHRGRRSNDTIGFSRAIDEDGTETLTWGNLFEFLVSPDGSLVTYAKLERSTEPAFETYLLGQVLGFALLKQGKEPLHASALEFAGRAFCLIGPPGTGKSSLAAVSLAAGARIMTDDLLLTNPSSDSGLLALPGLPRIKLYPEAAHALVPGLASWGAMNPFTAKMVIPLPPDMYRARPAPLARIYVLRRSSRRTRRATRLSQRDAYLQIAENTLNTVVRTPDRIARHFASASLLAATTPVQRLSYQDDLARLPMVWRSIQRDLES